MTGSGVPTSPLVPWTGLFESSTKPYESPTVPVLKKIRGDKGINRTCSSHLPSLGVRCQDKITTRSYDNELGLCTWSRSLLCWHPHPICDSKCVKMQLLWYCENPQKSDFDGEFSWVSSTDTSAYVSVYTSRTSRRCVLVLVHWHWYWKQDQVQVWL